MLSNKKFIRECIIHILMNSSINILNEEKFNPKGKINNEKTLEYFRNLYKNDKIGNSVNKIFAKVNKGVYDTLFGADGENQDIKDGVDDALGQIYYHGDKATPKQISLQKGLKSIFSYGNGKVSSDTLIVNIKSAMNCPSLAYCAIGKKGCYAHNHENQYNNTRFMDARNEVLWRVADSTNKLDVMFEAITSYLVISFSVGHPIHYIRISEAGDFPNQRVYDAFNEYAGKLERNEIFPEIITNPIYTTAYSANPNINYINIKDGGHIKIIGSRLDIKGAEHYFFGIPANLFFRLPNTAIKRDENGKPCNAIVRPLSDITDREVIQYITDCGYGKLDTTYYYKCICASIDEKDTNEVNAYNAVKSDENYNIDDILYGGANKCKNCQLCYERMPAIDMNGNSIDKYIVFCKIHGSNKGEVKNSDLIKLQRGGKDAKRTNGIDSGLKNDRDSFDPQIRQDIYNGTQKLNKELYKLRKLSQLKKSEEENNGLMENKGKKITLTENQMNQLLKLMESNSNLKKKYIRNIYKVALPIIDGLHRDDNWQPIIDLSNAMNELDFIDTFDIWPENGGYRQNSDGTQWKEYKVNIETKDGITIGGIVNCHAAGTMEDPFDRYDMTFTMW